MGTNGSEYGVTFVDRTLEERVKDIIRTFVSLLWQRPRKVVRLLRNPSVVDGPTYFPDKKRKSRKRIILDQVANIMLHEDIERYYYLYGNDIKGSRRSEYTPYMEFMRRRNRLNFRSEHNSSCILRNKLFFGSIAKTLGIPTPQNVILTFCNTASDADFKCPPEGVRLSDGEKESLVSLLSQLEGSYFCKPLDGECGSGVVKLVADKRESGSVNMDGVIMTVEAAAELLSDSSYLIQNQITQHPAINKIYPLSINTVRLVTVRDVNTGRIEVFPSVLRIGNLGNNVDNFSMGGIVVNIDLDTGQLESTGFMKSEYGTLSSSHPSSGVIFSECCVPFIKEAVAMAKKFHFFLDLHSIGWDIAITPDGPCFIEGNDNWEIDAQQNALHPLDKYYKQYFFKKK